MKYICEASSVRDSEGWDYLVINGYMVRLGIKDVYLNNDCVSHVVEGLKKGYFAPSMSRGDAIVAAMSEIDMPPEAQTVDPSVVKSMMRAETQFAQREGTTA